MWKIFFAVISFVLISQACAQPLYYFTTGDVNKSPGVFEFNTAGELTRWGRVSTSLVAAAVYSPYDGMFYSSSVTLGSVIVSNPATFETQTFSRPNQQYNVNVRLQNGSIEVLTTTGNGLFALDTTTRRFEQISSIKTLGIVGVLSDGLLVVNGSTLNHLNETTDTLTKIADRVCNSNIIPDPFETSVLCDDKVISLANGNLLRTLELTGVSHSTNNSVSNSANQSNVAVSPDGFAYSYDLCCNKIPLSRTNVTSGKRDLNFAGFYPDDQILNATKTQLVNFRNLAVLWTPAQVSVIEETYELTRVNMTYERYNWTSKVELQIAAKEQSIFQTVQQQAFNDSAEELLTSAVTVNLSSNVTIYRFRVKYTGVSDWVGYSLHTELPIVRPEPPVTPPITPPVDEPVNAPVDPPVDEPIDGPLFAVPIRVSTAASLVTSIIFMLSVMLFSM